MAMNDFVADSKRSNRFLAENVGSTTSCPTETWGPCGGALPPYSPRLFGSVPHATSTTTSSSDSIRRERELMKWNNVRKAWDNSAQEDTFDQATTPRYAGFASFGFDSSAMPQLSPPASLDPFYSSMAAIATEQAAPPPTTTSSSTASNTLQQQQRRYTYQIPTEVPFSPKLYPQRHFHNHHLQHHHLTPIARPKQHSLSSLTDFSTESSPSTSQFSLLTPSTPTTSAPSSRRPSSSTPPTNLPPSLYCSSPGSTTSTVTTTTNTPTATPAPSIISISTSLTSTGTNKLKKPAHKHCTWCGHTGHQKQNCRDLTAAFRDGIVHARKGKICLGRSGDGGEPIPYPHGEKTLRDWVWKRRGLQVPAVVGTTGTGSSMGESVGLGREGAYIAYI